MNFFPLTTKLENWGWLNQSLQVSPENGEKLL
jgi:hypothetical protein